MAQTGYTPILIYSSSTASQAPAAGNLLNSTLGSELAINITDGKLFYKDNANAVQVIAWKVTPTTAGGTGLTSYTAGDLLYYASGTTLTKLGIGASGQWLGSSGTAPQWNAPAALTKTDDTNVTLTLGGSASTALLNAASLTLGWTGQLATSRGGTGLASFSANQVFFASSTSAIGQSANFTWDGTSLVAGGTSNSTPGIIVRQSNSNNGVFRLGQTGKIYAILGGDYQGAMELFTESGAGDILFTVAGTTRGRMNSSGFKPIAGNGIDYSANTPAAGMTSQLLNWYEEGTWTPTDGSGAGLSFSSTSNNCFYTRIGNVVTCIFNITYPTTSNTSPMRVSGLPFTSKSTASAVAGGYFSYQNTGVDLIILTESASTSFVVYIVSSAAVIQNVALSGKILRGVITYQV